MDTFVMDTFTVVALFIGGACCLFISMWGMKRFYRIVKNGIFVDATIVRTEKEKMNNPGEIIATSYTFVPILKYTVEGKEYQAEFGDGNSNSHPEFLDGKAVVICCEKNNPENFFVKDDKKQFLRSILFMIFGLVFIFVAVYAGLM
ncbi:MAG: DUF3592 domain-containing protein [Defluviitaleaceae bacterium]|nr:DUF3592 domain-containing protein [Defluviitaleaceae bacterium]